MLKLFTIILLLPLITIAQPTSTEIKRWQLQANNVEIIRDNYGIPHIYGNTDADAVFGLLYAQCEDDFKRVEMNYIEKLGRLAEVKGEGSIYSDLYIKLLIDSADAMKDYKNAPVWLKKLLVAYADAINYYLYKNKNTIPVLLNHFEPWYPLLWTDGSIGAISAGGITEDEVKNFYTGNKATANYNAQKFEETSTGSNGFAVAPAKTKNGNAILYINPHVTFYFRPEVHMVSNEGLNVYGAVTWGQFFIYQGFNEHCGWMHTSINADVADMYAEKITSSNNALEYEYDGIIKSVQTKNIVINYRKGNVIEQKKFKALYTHHGPVMAERNSQYITVKSSNRMMNGLIQSWQRTKSKSLLDYTKTMDLKGNTSNSTVFADNSGNIAYWHGNYIPLRDVAFDWSKPVDGSIKKTEWQGTHNLKDIVQSINPASGFIQNCNSTPFSVSGKNSPLKINYPKYMAPDGENFRAINAVRLLENENKFTIDKMIETGYNKKLAAFEILVPALVKKFENNIGINDSLYFLKEIIDTLKKWNVEVDENSIATTVAVEWAQLLSENIKKVYVNENERDIITTTKKFAQIAVVNDLALPLAKAIRNLENKYGSWKITWGTINRYQRISGDINQIYKDDALSYPVPFASAIWGMLPSYDSRYFAGTKKRYGVAGNSFVCAVEFGKKVKAKSLLAGGNSGNPSSPHFTDQLLMYTKGIFKDVLFYREDVLRHSEREYHPGY
jgi:acyl-homoserine-lactone acylase